jgi:2-polyprenyl-3-methyl-5-hydroxy-6-metoxy-1,4-benzoquinol methylase
MVEVLEHAREPRTLIRAARQLLRPGGSFYVTTPHARGLSERLLGMKWSVVSPPEHLQLFSICAVESSGLSVRALSKLAR